MPEQQPRTYVGSGKRVKDYDLINISICMSGLPTGAVYEYNGKTYLNLTVGGKKGGPDQYGKTHSVWLNDFKPEKKANRAQENMQPRRDSEVDSIEYPGEDINPEDIPF